MDKKYQVVISYLRNSTSTASCNAKYTWKAIGGQHATVSGRIRSDA
jgi:hypothetical protein